VHDPLRARFDLSPHLAQRILGRPARSVAKAAVVKERLENRLKPIEQRLLAHTVNTRRNAQWTPLARFARLRDVDPSDRQRPETAGNGGCAMRRSTVAGAPTPLSPLPPGSARRPRRSRGSL